MASASTIKLQNRICRMSWKQESVVYDVLCSSIEGLAIHWNARNGYTEYAITVVRVYIGQNGVIFQSGCTCARLSVFAGFYC